MFSFLNLPVKVIQLLESNVSSREIALGVVLALFLGFVPMNGPMALLLWLFFFLLKLNRLSTLLILPLFKAFYLMGLSTLIERFGGYLLIDAGYLTRFWEVVTHLPVVAYLDLNNTLVAGGITLSLILSVPVYLVSERVAHAMRQKYGEKMKDSRVAKWVRALKTAHTVAGKIDKLEKFK